MTAYHVIQHARGIQVIHSGSGYSNIIVEAIAPEHDLARLKIVGLSQPASYLGLVYDLPLGIQDEELYVFGHGGGISNQRLVARMTRPGPTLSRDIRGPRLERLFRAEDVRLLPLQTTIYNGISGGPVLSRHGVIGILSGSIGEGGTIAWAIPVEYARPGKMRVLNRPASDIRDWPETTLMFRNWKSLRKSVLISEGLAQAIERYFFAVDDLAAIHEKMPLLYVDALVSTQMLREYVEQRADMPLDDILDPNSYLVQKYEVALLALSEALTKERPAAHLRVGYCIQDLTPAVSDLFKNDIARTQKNYWIKKEFTQLLRSMTAEGFELEALSSGDRKAMEMAGLLGKPPESTADLLALLRAMENLAAMGTKPEVIIELHALIRQFRRVGHIVEGLLVADFEGKGEWFFTSDWGYEILMPSGWEFVALGDDDILREQAETARANDLELDAVFRNKFGEELGLQSTVALQSGIMLGLAVSEVTDDIVSEWNQGIRLTFPDAKAYSKTIGDKQMLVGHYAILRDNQPYINYYAVIPYKEDAIWLQFEIPAERTESLLPQCEHVLGRISFK